MLKYTLVQKRNLQDPEGPKKWYASPKLVQRLEFPAVCRRVTRHTSIAPTEMKSAMDLLVEVLPEILCDSNSANIGIGTLRMSYGSEGADSPEVFDVSMIRNPKLIFTPSKDFLAAIAREISFENIGVVEEGFTYPSIDEYKKYKVAQRDDAEPQP